MEGLNVSRLHDNNEFACEYNVKRRKKNYIREDIKSLTSIQFPSI